MLLERQKEVKRKTQDVKKSLSEKSEILRLEKLYQEAKK
jgi:hypothetical protein